MMIDKWPERSSHLEQLAACGPLVAQLDARGAPFERLPNDGEPPARLSQLAVGDHREPQPLAQTRILLPHSASRLATRASDLLDFPVVLHQRA